MTQSEQSCYGMSKADIRDQYINSISAKLGGVEMVVMSILSDCQEMMDRKNSSIPSPNVDEFIRQQLNIAKFLIKEMMLNKTKSA
jgi:trans-2-enoyl-CoA reductase